MFTERPMRPDAGRTGRALRLRAGAGRNRDVADRHVRLAHGSVPGPVARGRPTAAVAAPPRGPEPGGRSAEPVPAGAAR